MLMNIEQLKQINKIEQITEQTAAALTEPIQPTYLLLKPEQYNLIAQTISATGQAIVQSTDLISKLPTHQDLNDLIIRTLRPNASEIWEIVDRRTDSMKYSVEEKLSKQTESLTQILDRRLSQNDDGNESERFDAVEAQTEMDIDWSDIAVNTAYLAADLQMMFGGTDDKKTQKKKTVRERKYGQKKKEAQSQDIDFEIKM